MNHIRLLLLAGFSLSSLTGGVEAQSLAKELKAEGSESLAKAALEKGNAVRGAILFPQQKPGCASCHTPGAENLLGPDLTVMGKEATDTYLVDAMLYPSKVIKKGFESSTVVTVAGKTYSGRIVSQTGDRLVLRDSSNQGLITLFRTDIDAIEANKTSTMPDGLVDQLADRQQFLDILRYMIEIRSVGPSPERNPKRPTVGTSVGGELHGLVLIDDFKCLACHRNELPKIPMPPKQAPELAWGSGRINPHYIERFIASPLQIKPGTTMPDVMGHLSNDDRRAAAREITHYIVSLGKEMYGVQPLNPIAAGRGREAFHSVGCVACHSPRGENGVERLPDKSVPLGMLESKYNLDGLVAFLENPHDARPSGRMPNMRLSHWEAIDIAQYLLGRSQDTVTSKPFQLDSGLAQKGKKWFDLLGCAQCHRKAELPPEPRGPVIVKANSDIGCLSGKKGKWPRYDLDDSQRNAIKSAIEREPFELTNQQQISVTLTTFKCVACHQYGDGEGISPDRNEYFQTTNPNLGPQGRIPPRLTGVGAKLRSKWMRQVLVSGRAIRPYMKTRMPQYGTDNIEHLVEAFQSGNQLPLVTFEDISDPKQMRNTGHEMAGSAGLNCIACHTFQRKRATTMPAVDLTEMTERLHQDWFYHYMQDPQRFSANTIMPSFWPGGRAIRKDILEGDTKRQIEAMWRYLLEGRQARAPKGLIREPIEFVVTDEAVMLRRSYNGIGKRGIGVGYLNQVNLAFDAEQMRLAMIWKGKFADPGGVWRGQGSGTVRPLGRNLIRFARGPDVDDATNPWTAGDGRPPQHEFKGYHLDRLQRPTFMYRFDNIDIEDYPIDVLNEDSGEVSLRRTLTFTSKQARANVALRVATNDKIAAEDNTTFRIGDSLLIRITGEYKGQIVDTLAGKQLRVPMNVDEGKSSLILEYFW